MFRKYGRLNIGRSHALRPFALTVKFVLIFIGQESNKTIQRIRINNQITAPELRVIDNDGKNLGVLPLKDALKLASPDSGLDLIEVGPTAKPPVARIMDYDKYRYDLEKQEKKERKALKGGELKQIQISAREAQNDLQRKAGLVVKFFEEGHNVEVALWLRGREKYNKPWARQKMDEFLKLIPIEYKLFQEPKFGGRGMTAQIAKK